MDRKGNGIMKYLAVLALVCTIAISAVAAPTDRGLIAAADAAFARGPGFSLAAYAPRLRTALTTYEQALPLIPADAVQTRAYVLDRLARGYFELGLAYLTTDRHAQEQAFAKGKDYALESLRLDPQFVATEKKSFRAALSGATDVRAIFWYGNNLGSYLNFHFLTAISGGVRDVKAAFERAIALDARYLGGGPWRALGSFFAKVPGFLGGSRDQARAAFAHAITLGPNFLENYVDAAEYVYKPDKDWTNFCATLHTAINLSKDPTAMAAWPLYNALALNRAKALITTEQCK